VSVPTKGEAVVPQEVSGRRAKTNAGFFSLDTLVDPSVIISSMSYCEPSKADAVDQVTVREGLVLAPKAQGRCKGSGMLTERK